MSSKATLNQDIRERKYTVNRIASLFKAIESIYQEYVFNWIKVQTNCIKDVKSVFSEFDFTLNKVDGIGFKTRSNKELGLSGSGRPMSMSKSNDNTVLVIHHQSANNSEAFRDFKVHRDKMTLALNWLKENNHYYANIIIDFEVFQSLPIDSSIDDQLQNTQIIAEDFNEGNENVITHIFICFTSPFNLS
ncbi:hypothetical protein C1645_830274 [Glomus cerebriforme]|uniref:DUF6570 domain-containing protein n=1 Tax=Glomus cerebriforme TaxID=658196 RepID=A0A397SHP4_9GLOM|nr:hypothetical protein C1645_830274 [Glomus cerebriforme]